MLGSHGNRGAGAQTSFGPWTLRREHAHTTSLETLTLKYNTVIYTLISDIMYNLIHIRSVRLNTSWTTGRVSQQRGMIKQNVSMSSLEFYKLTVTPMGKANNDADL